MDRQSYKLVEVLDLPIKGELMSRERGDNVLSYSSEITHPCSGQAGMRFQKDGYATTFSKR
jgi:hypothetical protein